MNVVEFKDNLQQILQIKEQIDELPLEEFIKHIRNLSFVGKNLDVAQWFENDTTITNLLELTHHLERIQALDEIEGVNKE